MTNRFIISIGSNLPDLACQRVEQAIDHLALLGQIEARSHVYTTPSVTHGDSSTYSNAVVILDSQLPLETLADRCKQIEQAMGRKRSTLIHAVEIDIDIVVANNNILRPRDHSRSYFQIGLQSLR